MDNFGCSQVIPEIGSIILEKLPVLFGMGIVENIYDETACIKTCLPEQFYAVEACLLRIIKTYIARLPWECHWDRAFSDFTTQEMIKKPDLEAALKTIGAIAPSEARVIHIKNTLEKG